MRDSNSRHSDLESDTLPTELTVCSSRNIEDWCLTVKFLHDVFIIIVLQFFIVVVQPNSMIFYWEKTATPIPPVVEKPSTVLPFCGFMEDVVRMRSI